VKYAWIQSQREHYPLALMCRLLGVSRSGFHTSRSARRGERTAARAREAAHPIERIRHVQQRHRMRYGRQRMSAELRALECCPINEKRVARLIHEAGLQCRKWRVHRTCTTDSSHGLAIAENLLDRDFCAAAPDRKWQSDLTYVYTDEGWLYVAFVLDLFARKIIG
jgi:putative transposase